MAGNQSRGLIAASKTRGWDPTQIPGGGSIANFDKDQTNIPPGDSSLGTLPEGIHDVYKDGFDMPSINPDGGITWTAPDYTRETKSRGTTNANPTMGE